MKKFSKLILEEKQEKIEKHPLVNDVDWQEIFLPLIEHINGSLISKVPPPGEGLFSSRTKGALDKLIDSITEDYVEYYQNVMDDGSQDSFLAAYSINIKNSEITSCLHPITDRHPDVYDFASWDGGYYYIGFTKLKYENTNDLIEDILDVWSKLKMYDISYKITLTSNNKQCYYINSPSVIQDEEKITKGIKNLLELPGQKPEMWVRALLQIEIRIYNKDTVQSVDL